MCGMNCYSIFYRCYNIQLSSLNIAANICILTGKSCFYLFTHQGRLLLTSKCRKFRGLINADVHLKQHKTKVVICFDFFWMWFIHSLFHLLLHDEMIFSMCDYYIYTCYMLVVRNILVSINYENIRVMACLAASIRIFLSVEINVKLKSISEVEEARNVWYIGLIIAVREFLSERNTNWNSIVHFFP